MNLPDAMDMEVAKYSNLSDEALLQKLIGVGQSRKLYQGSLHQLFNAAAPEAGTAQEACLVARELVARWIFERGLP